ncbi:MAG: LysM peptidoglycan-binding domain-containing protein, partial [Bacteroidetes bacterium]
TYQRGVYPLRHGAEPQSRGSYAVSCANYTFNDQFLNDVNNVSRQVYVVLQQTSGYLLVPVIAATRIVRSGTYYLYRAPNYSFAIDTSNLVYESNIATGSSDWYIYFNGLKIRGCYYEYSFKREPTRVSQERSEFDFIPGIGITTERTGMTAVEAENNQYRLVKVNGLALEDYIVSRCQGKTTTGAPLSQYTPQVTYGAGTDKETASMTNQPVYTETNPLGPPPLADCPEMPGEGYHIVQPKETLNGISRAYNIPVKSLVAWNNIKDPDLILICQKIWLRKPPANATSLAYKGEQKPAAYGTSDGTIVQRQDIYWNKGVSTAPATYSTAPTTTQPEPTTIFTPAAKPLIHTVQKGETLYGIGQRYGITEAEMRRLNSYPATGTVLLQPGMQVFVADCCPDQGAAATQPVVQPATATQPAGNYMPQLTTQPTTSGVQPLAPATYGQPATTTPTTTQPTTATQPNQTAKPAYFQEYIVREGDTMNSIAIKFKVSAQELALVNNKEPNETLIAGQRLLIPRN